jgi:hypothetical protein
MIVALVASAVVALALVADVLGPPVAARIRRLRERRFHFHDVNRIDPGREFRAEQRARELLRSCVGDEEWAMYRELGFIRVWGRSSVAQGTSQHGGSDGGEHAYLIYPHRPVVSYLPSTGRLMHEYCVSFPDQDRPYGSSRLPDSDDVLAKWMALTGDERRLLNSANMHLVGHQLDTNQLTRDVWRLSRWERGRLGQHGLINA